MALHPIFKRRLALALGLGGLVFVGFSLFANLKDLGTAFSRFAWPYFGAALVLAFLNYCARFCKFHYYLNVLGIKTPYRESFSIFLSGLVMSITPAKLGEVLKSFLLKESQGTPIARTAPIVVAERLTDFIAMLMLSLGGILSYQYGTRLIAVSVGILLIFFLLIGVPGIASRLIGLIKRLPRMENWGDKLREAYQSTRELIALKPLVIASLISLPAWFFECLAFYLVLKGFALDVSLHYATFVYALATIIGALSMLPGGLGLTEGGLTGFIILVGVARSEAVAATFIVRVATLWFAILIGAAALILRHQRLSALERIIAEPPAAE